MLCPPHISMVLAADNSSAADILHINCGDAEWSVPADENNRKWRGDGGTQFATSFQNTSTDDTCQHSVLRVSYATARFFTTNFTYSFNVTPGRKFVRLYFYPANYTDHKDSLALFAVTLGRFTLLNNFSTSHTAQVLNLDRIVREYYINVSSEGFLNLTFAPSPNISNSYAFINGIEIVSTPEIFPSDPLIIVGDVMDIPIPSDSSVALETAYRLNVGGNTIPADQDSGLFREWNDDSPYIYGAGFGVTYSKDANVTIKYPNDIPEYIAPMKVYSTARSMGPTAQLNLNYNLTWILPVDPGFHYLVRLHFCEIQYPITKDNQRVFDIFINNRSASEEAADVISWTDGIGAPTYRDFAVTINDGDGDLWLALHPNIPRHPEYDDAILNGIEIFKLSDKWHNLAVLYETARPSKSTPADFFFFSTESNYLRKHTVSAIVGSILGGVIMAFVLWFLFKKFHLHCRWRGNLANGLSKINLSEARNHCHRFSLVEMEVATNNFDKNHLLGVGGFGKVYLGNSNDGSIKVAIKRGSSLSKQGAHEFKTEIEMLSKLRHRHRHLVSLIGYCEERDEMILVYEYMANGTLREHLYRTRRPPLSWKQRLDICVGAARGLHYLHTGSKHTIVHRDVKTTNILLDDNN